MRKFYVVFTSAIVEVDDDFNPETDIADLIEQADKGGGNWEAVEITNNGLMARPNREMWHLTSPEVPEIDPPGPTGIR
jgi:hypothetical protein